MTLRLVACLAALGVVFAPGVLEWVVSFVGAVAFTCLLAWSLMPAPDNRKGAES